MNEVRILSFLHFVKYIYKHYALGFMKDLVLRGRELAGWREGGGECGEEEEAEGRGGYKISWARVSPPSLRIPQDQEKCSGPGRLTAPSPT